MHMHKQQTYNSKSILEQVQLRAMRSQRLSFLLCKRAATRQTTATKNYKGFPAYKRCVVVGRNIWRSGKGTTHSTHHSKGRPHTLRMPTQDTVQRTHCNGKWRCYLVSATGITDAGDQTAHTPNTHIHRFICTFVVRMTMANAQLHNFSTIVTWSGSQPNCCWWCCCNTKLLFHCDHNSVRLLANVCDAPVCHCWPNIVDFVSFLVQSYSKHK